MRRVKSRRSFRFSGSSPLSRMAMTDTSSALMVPLLAHGVAAAPRDFVPPEIGAPDGHPALRWNLGRLNVIDTQNCIQGHQISL